MKFCGAFRSNEKFFAAILELFGANLELFAAILELFGAI